MYEIINSVILKLKTSVNQREHQKEIRAAPHLEKMFALQIATKSL